MGIFFRLGDPQLLQMMFRNHFPQRLAHIFRRKHGRHQGLERIGIFGKPGCCAKARHALTNKAVKAFVQQGGGNLPRPVGAEIGEQQSIAILHPGIVAQHTGHDKLIGDVLVVR